MLAQLCRKESKHHLHQAITSHVGIIYVILKLVVCTFEMPILVYFTVAKQHGSLELKSACLVCGCSVVECVDKDSKLIRPPSGKKAALD